MLITGFFGRELLFFTLVVSNLFNARPHLTFLILLPGNTNLGQTLTVVPHAAYPSSGQDC